MPGTGVACATLLVERVRVCATGEEAIALIHGLRLRTGSTGLRVAMTGVITDLRVVMTGVIATKF